MLLRYGSGVVIQSGTLLALKGGELTMGDRVIIGSYSNIRAFRSFIRIGSRVQLAQFVSLIATNHLIGPDGVPSIDEADLRPGHHGITIGDDCWLGVNVTILPGVELGDRCVVAAGAVVTKSFPPGSRIMGVPGRAT